MKYLKGIVIITLVMVLSITGQALAGKGYGRGQTNTGSSGTGVCPYATSTAVNIFEDADAVTISGTVATAPYNRQGMQIDTGTEVVTIYGLGPIRYWDSLGIDRPAIGDAITVNGYNVTFSDGTEKIIAAKVTIGEETIQLRNEETGAPLWRGSFRGRGGKGNCPYGGGGCMLNGGVCPRVQTPTTTDSDSNQ